jgi:predicted outer membrane repeat protein
MSGADTVEFQDGLTGTISLNSDIAITDDVDVAGPGQSIIIIDAQMNGRIFTVDYGDDNNDISVSISALKLINGHATAEEDNTGGAISSDELLTLDSCVFENNSSSAGGAVASTRIINEIKNCTFNNNSTIGRGGAVWNQFTVNSISNSEFSGNDADMGGAIFNEAPVVIKESMFSDNTSAEGGGAIYNDDVQHESTITASTFDANGVSNGNGGAILNNRGGGISIMQSTFSNNSAETNSNLGFGGAIYNNADAGLIQITNSTFSGNDAAGQGGAIYNNADMNISFTTIAKNNAHQGGGVSGGPGTKARNSIIAFNTSSNGTNCDPNGLFGGGNWNYSDDDTCGFDKDNANILFGPLANNGGATQTFELMGFDPVNGASANCDPLGSNGTPTGKALDADQRGFPRPAGDACEAGSFERQGTGTITVILDTDPEESTGFQFEGSDMPEGCELEGTFTMEDGDTISCVLPAGTFTVQEVNLPDGYGLDIDCSPMGQAVIDNDSIVFATVPGGGGEGVDIACTFTNTLTDGATAAYAINLIGTGSGNVSALGIDCGSSGDDCTQMHPVGTTVMLIPTPDLGSKFVGFSGHPDCEDGVVTLDEDKTCTAQIRSSRHR